MALAARYTSTSEHYSTCTLNRFSKVDRAENYCKRVIFRVHNIYQTLNFHLFDVDLIQCLIPYLYRVFIYACLAIYLVWRRDTTAKVANVIRLYYTAKLNIGNVLMILST